MTQGERQRKAICHYIARFRDEQGYAPSIREITSEIHAKSTSHVALHLVWLELHGYINRDARIARSIRLTEAGQQLARGA